MVDVKYIEKCYIVLHVTASSIAIVSCTISHDEYSKKYRRSVRIYILMKRRPYLNVNVSLVAVVGSWCLLLGDMWLLGIAINKRLDTDGNSMKVRVKNRHRFYRFLILYNPCATGNASFFPCRKTYDFNRQSNAIQIFSSLWSLQIMSVYCASLVESSSLFPKAKCQS